MRKAAAGKARPQAARTGLQRGRRGAASCSHRAEAGKARSHKLRRRGSMQRQGTSCSYEAAVKKMRGLPSPEHVCRKSRCPCDRFASGTPSGSLPSAHLAENEAAGDKNHRYVRSFLLLTFLHQFRPGQTQSEERRVLPAVRFRLTYRRFLSPDKTFSARHAWRIAPRHRASKTVKPACDRSPSEAHAVLRGE